MAKADLLRLRRSGGERAERGWSQYHSAIACLQGAEKGLQETYLSLGCDGRRGGDSRSQGRNRSVAWRRGRRAAAAAAAIVDHNADARAGRFHVVRGEELVDVEGLAGLGQAGDGRARLLLEEQEGVLALARLAEAARAGIWHERLGLGGDTRLHAVGLEPVLGEVQHGGVGVGGVEHHDEERDARVDGRLV